MLLYNTVSKDCATVTNLHLLISIFFPRVCGHKNKRTEKYILQASFDSLCETIKGSLTTCNLKKPRFRDGRGFGREAMHTSEQLADER